MDPRRWLAVLSAVAVLFGQPGAAQAGSENEPTPAPPAPHHGYHDRGHHEHGHDHGRDHGHHER